MSRKQLQLVISMVDKVTKPYKGIIQTSKKFTDNFQDANKSIRNVSQSSAIYSGKLRNLKNELNQLNPKSKNFVSEQKRLKTSIAQTNLAISTQSSRLKKLRNIAAKQRYRKAFQDKLSNMSFRGAAGMATGYTGLRIGQNLLSSGLDFGASMSKTGALAGIDKTSPFFKQLKDQSLALNADSKFSANSIAEGQGFLAMSGLKPQEILDATEGVAILAEATGNSIEETARISSDIMKSSGLRAKDMNRISDVMAVTLTSSNQNLSQLADVMKYAAPVAKNLGLSLEETAASAAMMADAGIQGTMGGTAMRGILTRLTSGVPKVNKALAELGVEVAENGNLKSFPVLLAEIGVAANKLPGDVKKMEVLQNLGGKNAISGFFELIDAAGGQKMQKMIKNLKNSAGVAKKMRAAMLDNASGDLAKLRSSWEGFMVSIFESKKSGIRSFIQDLKKLVNLVKDWSGKNPKLVKTILSLSAAFFGLALVGGTLLFALSGILGPLAFLITSFTVLGGGIITGVVKGVGLLTSGIKFLTLAMIANPIGAIITGVIALGVAAYYLFKHWDKVKPFFESLWQDVKDINNAIGAWLGQFFTNLALSFWGFGSELISSLIKGIKESVKDVYNVFSEIGAGISSTFKSILGINSPSKVFKEFGANLNEGLVLGIEKTAALPLAATAKIAKSLAVPVGLTMGAASGTGFASDKLTSAGQQTASPIVVNITINNNAEMDNSNSVSLAKKISQTVREELTKKEAQKNRQIETRFFN